MSIVAEKETAALLKPSKPRVSAGERISGWMEAAVPLLPVVWLAIFFVTPLVFTIIYSFAHATFGGVQLAFTFSNFKQALSGFYLHIFIHTLIFAASGTLEAMIVGLPLAYVLGRKAGKYKVLLIILVLVPYWTSFLLRTLSWETLMAQGGVIQGILNFLHLHSGPLGWLDTNTAVGIGLVYGYLPLMVVPLFISFDRIPEDMIEASKDLGAGRIRTFLSVTLPMAKAGVATALLLTFVPMTGEFVIPALLGGAKGVLMGGLIYNEYLAAADYPLGSAMAVLVMLVIAITLVIFTRTTKGFAEVGAV